MNSTDNQLYTNRNTDKTLVVSLEKIEDYTYMVPSAYIYFGKRTEVSSWEKLYISCCKCLYKDYPHIFEQLKGRAITDGQCIDIGDVNVVSDMKAASFIGEGIYVETDFNTADLMKRLRVLLGFCNVDSENLQIECRKETILAKNNDAEKNHIQNDNEVIHKKCADFVLWMSRMGMSKELISSILLAVKQCSRYANDKKFADQNIYLLSLDVLTQLKKQLFGDTVFCVFDQKMNHRFENAFDKYTEFCAVCTEHALIMTSKQREEKETEKAAVSICKNERYGYILKEFFPDGLRQNVIHIKKFMQRYEEYFKEKIAIERDEIFSCLASIGTVRDGRIYAKQSAEQSSLTKEIFTEIGRVFKNGGTCIYLSMILQRYRQQLGEQAAVYNVDALKALLMESKPDYYYIRNGYICSSKERTDCSEDVLFLLRSSHKPLTYDDMKSNLWYLPIEKIKHALMQIPSVVNVDKETYFYAPNLPVSENEQQVLLHVIQEEIDQKGFLTARHLKTLMEQHCPAAAIDTAFMKDWGLRNALGYLFRDSFEFNDAIVNKNGEKFSVSDAYQNFCLQREKMTLSELEEFSADIHVPIYWQDIFEVMIRISEKEFIHKENVHFNVEAADSVLDTLCPGDYIPIQEIQLFLQFPSMEVPWNLYVLECYVRQYSKKFRLEQANITKAGCFGVIVRKNCKFKNYEQVVMDMLARSDKWNDEDSALALIVSLGYRANRHWKGFSKITKQALLLREQLEKKEK